MRLERVIPGVLVAAVWASVAVAGGTTSEGFMGDRAIAEGSEGKATTGRTEAVVSANSAAALTSLGSVTFPTTVKDGDPSPSVITIKEDVEIEIEGNGVIIKINGVPTTFKDGDQVKFKKGDKVEFGDADGQISPQNFVNLARLAPSGMDPKTGKPTNPSGILPPRNRISVIDQEEWQKYTPTEKAKKQIYRTVTRIRYYTVLIPIYQNRSATCYPCCCTCYYSVLVGYRSERRSDVSVSLEPAGADYPITQIYTDRTVYVEEGNPEYTTRLPRLCKSHYGTNAPDYPSVPIVTDPRDNPNTSTGAETKVSNQPNGDTIIVTKSSVPTKVPIGDPDKGLPAGDVTDPGRGLNTFSGDETYVADNLVESQQPDGSYQERRPGK